MPLIHNQPSEQVPPYDPYIAQRSVENLARYDDALKGNFISAVNILSGTQYLLVPPTEMYFDPQYGYGKAFPANHEFYKTVYNYLRKHNPSLLNESIYADDNGVTYTKVARYMMSQAERVEITKTARRSTITVTPEGTTAIQETAQNLSGLKALLVKDIADQGQKTNIIKEIEDVEKKRESIIDSPTSFNNSRTKEIQDVLTLLPGNFQIFAEKMLNYLLVGGLIQSGVIPYIDTNGTTKLNFTPQCSPQIRQAWQPAADNANDYIPPETLKGFMAYTSTKQSPNATMGVITSRMPKNTPLTPENILQAPSIPNSQKSLALTTLKNNGTSLLLDEKILKDASADAARFSEAKISDSLQMITDQTSRFEDLAKKGQLPKNEKEWADLVRSPVKEAGKRFGTGGSLLVLFGSVMLAMKVGTTFANKMSSDGKAKWWGKTLGFIAALAGFSVGSNILGNYIENIPLEKVDPNKTANEKKKLSDQFVGCRKEFRTDVFPGLFILSQDVGPDANNQPFEDRIPAAELFENGYPGSPKKPFNLHPNVVDQLPELLIDGKKVSPESLNSYKAIYRAVYLRRQDIIEARRKEPDTAKKEALFDVSLLDPKTKKLKQFLAEFYREKDTNYSEKIPAEGFDISPPRMNNFGLTTFPTASQDAKVQDIKDTFTNIPATVLPMISIPFNNISTVYDKKPQDIIVGGTPPQDRLQLPVWDPAELGTIDPPSYEQTKLPSGEYLVKITYTPASPTGVATATPQDCLIIMEPTTTRGTTYKISSLLINGVAYTQ